MSDIDTLVAKHRRNGVLVDANLLVLWLVGRVNPRRICQFKRTQSYDEHDFYALSEILAQFPRKLTTPGIWTEVSNLTDLAGDELMSVRRLIREDLQVVEEHHVESFRAANHPVFTRLGLTDAAICEYSREPMLVLTDDLDLYVALRDQEVDSFKFSWLRG
jgi:hypothetical protein